MTEFSIFFPFFGSEFYPLNIVEEYILLSMHCISAGLTDQLWTGIIEKTPGGDLRFAGTNITATYRDFHPSEPSSGARDDFVALNQKSNWMMEDYTAHSTFSFICEK